MSKFTEKLMILDKWINRNTGWIIVMVLVAFNIYSINILQDTRSILRGQAENIEARSKAVNFLISDNQRQSELIICVLAVHGDVSIITEVDTARCKRLTQEVKGER